MSNPKSDQPSGYTYKYKRLYDLGSDRLGVIESMLTNGDSPQKCAEHIQDEWKQYQSVKTPTLTKQIQRYKADVLEPKLVMAAEQAVASGKTITKEMKNFREQVDVMEKLNETINMQTVRIQKAYANEAKKGPDAKLDQNISKELRALTDMCRALATLQLETGVVRRVPKQVQGFFSQLSSEDLQEFRAEMTQNDETLKSLGVITDVLKEAAEETLDGDYVPLSSESGQLSGDNEPDLESESH